MDTTRLDGKKTYVIGALLALVSVAYAMKYIDQQTYLTIMGILNAGGMASMRHGVEKSGPVPPQE